MARDFVERLRAEAGAWVEDGIISDEQRAEILDRYRGEPADGADRSGIAVLLYAVAGILVGAAGVALLLTGFDVDRQAIPFAVVAGVLGGLGLVLRGLPGRSGRWDLLADALLVGALVPLTVASAEPFQNAQAIAPLAVLAPLALGAWRRTEGFVLPLSVIAVTVAGGLAVYTYEDPIGWDPAIAWMFLQLVVLAGVLSLNRLSEGDPANGASGLAVLATLAPWTFLLFETADLGSETVELLAGLLLLAWMGLGAWLEDRGAVVGATTGLGIDAIVFAFDVGGVWLGTLTLVAVAALLIWQAETLRAYVEKV